MESGLQPPRDPISEKLVLSDDSGMVLVLIPSGSFRMGSQLDDANEPNFSATCELTEIPVHDVALKPFFLSKFEMTQGQWLKLMGDNPAAYSPANYRSGAKSVLQQPVETVNWHRARRALRRLGLVLPSEAQWEYAARASTTTPWWCGTTKETIAAMEAGNLFDRIAVEKGVTWPHNVESWIDGFSASAPVGRFAPNDFGIHDVIGNVFEWCEDMPLSYELTGRQGDGLRSAELYPEFAATVVGNLEPNTKFRVFRGGAFNYDAHVARSSTRRWAPPEHVDHCLGIRPARPIDR